jgi:hypothetical protein
MLTSYVAAKKSSKYSSISLSSCSEEWTAKVILDT